MNRLRTLGQSRWVVGERLPWSIALILLVLGGFTVKGWAAHRGGIDPRLQPVDACAFIRTSEMPGRFYNDYLFGGYWLWEFGTERPVFIDGRLHTVAGYTTLYKQIEAAQAGPPAQWESFLAFYGADAALVQYPDASPIPAVFSVYFPRSRWALVYWDDLALIFIRRLPQYAPWIRRYEFSTITPEARPEDVLGALRHSARLREKVLLDLRRNERLHPDSRRVRQWLTLLNALTGQRDD